MTVFTNFGFYLRVAFLISRQGNVMIYVFAYVFMGYDEYLTESLLHSIQNLENPFLRSSSLLDMHSSIRRL